MHKFQSLIRQEKRKNSPSYVSKCLMSLYYYWLPLVLGKNFITLCFVYWKNSARILSHKDFVFYHQFPSWFYLNWKLFEFIFGLFLRIRTTVWGYLFWMSNGAEGLLQRVSTFCWMEHKVLILFSLMLKSDLKKFTPC